MKKICVLSGGLDSTVLLYKLVHEFGSDNVVALTFEYGQRHNIEIDKAKLSCEKLKVAHKIIDISFLGEVIKNVSSLSKDTSVDMPCIEEVLGDPQPVTYVPFRNMILNSIAFSVAESEGADTVYTGLQIHDEYSYWDTTHDFINGMNAITNLNRTNAITLEAPFADMSKCDEIKLGLTLGVPFEDTWTCYTGSSEGVACGTCPSCSERLMNFQKAGVIDPIKYRE